MMVRGTGSTDAEAADSGWVGEGGLSAGELQALDDVGRRLGDVAERRGLAAEVLAAWLR